MPPKKERLTKKDFSELGKRKTYKGHFFDLVYTQSDKHKIGCVVLKKRIPKAVSRNKIKRKIFHIYKEVHPKNPHTVIFYPKGESPHTSYQTLKDEIERAFATL